MGLFNGGWYGDLKEAMQPYQRPDGRVHAFAWSSTPKEWDGIEKRYTRELNEILDMIQDRGYEIVGVQSGGHMKYANYSVDRLNTVVTFR